MTHSVSEPRLTDLVAAIIKEVAALQRGVDTSQLTADSLLWAGSSEGIDGQGTVGLDSVDLLSLLVGLEERTGIETPAEVDASSCPTIGHLARLLSRQPRL